MSPKIFLTGATGYIGGSVFHTLATTYPTYDLTVLLRTVPADFPQLYPAVHILPGTYDDLSTLTAAAAAADIVIHTGNSDHAPSLRALLAGLRSTATASKPKHLLHLSGTGLEADWHTATPPGTLNPHVSSDASPTPATPWPSAALHAETENLVREAWLEEEAAEAPALRTAVIRPPDIYGRGIGPLARKSSFWVPWFVREIVGDGEEEGVGAGFYVGEGANKRGWVHLGDVVGLYVRLVEAAVRGEEGAVGWGRDGYYHVASQEASQLELAQAVSRILHGRGLVRSPEPVRVEVERLDGMMKGLGYPGIARYLFASNARSSAERAKGSGWEPRGPGLMVVLEQDVGDALEAMGDRAYYRIPQ